MENGVTRISKALLDLSRVADEVLYPTRKAAAAASDKELGHSQRCLLERIDGFRSLEQLLSMSGDVVGVHAAMGKLLAMGYVTCDPALVNAQPATPAAPAVAAKPVPPATPAKPQKVAAVAPLAAVSPTAHAAPAAKVPATQPPRPPAARAAPAAPAKPAAAAPAKSPSPAPVPVVSAANSEVENAKRLLLQEAKMVLGPGAAKLAPRVQACSSIEQVYDLIVKLQQHLAQTGKADPDVFLDRLSKGLASVRNQSESVATPRTAPK